MKYLFIVLSIFYSTHIFGQQKIYNILDYGAIRDSIINSQSAIQHAIDACSAAGGGVVYIPNGSFASNTIRLNSNITLWLDQGAKLYAIGDSTLYTNTKAGIQNTGDTFIPAFIVASNAQHIAIKGGGSIIGSPEFYEFPVTWDDSFPGWNANARKAGVKMIATGVKQPKVSLVYLSGCDDIKLEDIYIINSPNWSCHIQWSKNVSVKNITIRSSLTRGVNSDGLDIDGCNNVLVTGCTITTGDDAICLKTTRQNGRSEKCENIVINNCRLTSTSCAIKLGTESYADFNNIILNNCIIVESNRGLGIFIRDGAQVNNVLFSDIIINCSRKPFFWWGDGDAFQFVVLKRNAESKAGSIRNLTLKNIMAECEGGAVIRGLNDTSIFNVLLDCVNIFQHAELEPDKRAVNVLLIQHVEGVTLNNLALIRDSLNAEPKWQSPLAISDVKGFSLKGYTNNQQKINNHFPAFTKNNVTERADR